jgi:hypothetical protein
MEQSHINRPRLSFKLFSFLASILNFVFLVVSCCSVVLPWTSSLRCSHNLINTLVWFRQLKLPKHNSLFSFLLFCLYYQPFLSYFSCKEMPPANSFLGQDCIHIFDWVITYINFSCLQPFCYRCAQGLFDCKFCF